ncbi:MAG: filamentous hemagglutinin N-terminal domain-containing protein [Alphaproteobacteria bacterium]|nr:MAG: filamentous hemagglutinin N-terminal domain-containing protein [Alphaproteobacteria bacterium]
MGIRGFLRSKIEDLVWVLLSDRFWERYRAIRNVRRMVRGRLEIARDHARTIALYVGIGVLFSVPGYTNPTGGTVVSGDATIEQTSETDLTITQTTDKVIINWEDFSIGEGETTTFFQPDESAIALNRIISENPSVIFGQLNANGQLILINPNGILFTETAVVDVAGLIATTINIEDENFLAGDYIFDQPGSSTATVINKGSITAADQGLVAFVAPAVGNSGIITAKLGHVELGAASAFTLDLYGDGLISFPVDATVIEQAIGPDGEPVLSLVNVDGTIDVGGGTVVLTAQAARALVSNVISVGGDILATDFEQQGGTIILKGEGGAVDVAGTLDASGKDGGSIDISGDQVFVEGSLLAQAVAPVEETESSTAKTTQDEEIVPLSSGTPKSFDDTIEPLPVETSGAEEGGENLSYKGAEIADSKPDYERPQPGEGSTEGGPKSFGVVSVTPVDRGTPKTTHVESVTLVDEGAAVSMTGTGTGGDITISAEGLVSLSGTLDVTGSDGGSIDVNAGSLLVAGIQRADGIEGAGGTIVNQSSGSLLTTSSALTSASGATSGGTIVATAGLEEGNNFFSSGTYDASSSDGAGGAVTLNGSDVKLVDAHVDVSGGTDGGDISIGFTGSSEAPEVGALNTLISPHTTLNANAGETGTGGNVIIWSESATEFMGTITAKGGTLSGDGGFVEVSSKGEVGFAGVVDASATSGEAGTLLLDPKNLTIDASASSGTVSYFHYTDPNPDNGLFGSYAIELENGNIVITDYRDDFGGYDAGAVYLFDGDTGALISALTGTSFDDRVGFNGIIELSNSNYLIVSTNWDDGATADVGAVTWADGASGVSGVITAANSLVGSSSGDQVGIGGITILSNGNYVVNSYYWNNGSAADAGAVTWGDGTSGITGAVSSSNSLVGSTTNDRVGYFGVSALSNGNYVVNSPQWDNGAIVNAGAVTWGDGTTGISGAISAANSLVGTTAEDLVGNGQITVLPSGDYLVRSYQWDNGSVVAAGAVTWGDGTTGVSGAVSAANSLVGSTAGDYVGIGIITVLPNGNYVVSSPFWSDGVATKVGAVTWGNGTSGVTGVVSSSNSLVGSTANDQVGNVGITVLSNGNYVVRSTVWDNGAATDAGAVTWGSGTSGVTGVVSASNSLVGSTTNDQVGNSGIIVLTNGNYVVSSTLWNNGAITDAGAATWGDGTTGVTGVVSASNSLVGSAASDKVGVGGIVALPNGNYVVTSVLWNDVAIIDAGAVTWGDGTSGVSGVISSLNSLVGGTSYDRVGDGGVTVLSNGNYVVRSSAWHNGAAALAGAVTWGDGTSGITGLVTASNSLVGDASGNQVGSGGVAALPNGNYVVLSPYWDDGVATNVGAATWGDGTSGITGVVSSSNSLVGSTANDNVGYNGVAVLSNGNYIVISTAWDNGAAVNAGAVTWGDGTSGVTGVVSVSNSLVGGASNDNVGSNGITSLANGNYLVLSPYWDNGAATDAGAVTWGDGTSGVTGVVAVSNSLVGSTSNDLVGIGGITVLTNGNYVVNSYRWNNGATVSAGAVTWGDGTIGVSGAVSAANSLVGDFAYDYIGGNAELSDGTIIVNQPSYSTTGRVSLIIPASAYAGSGDILYSTEVGSDLTVLPSYLTDVLDTGTNLVLQASNDLTVNSDVIVNNGSGNGGALTLQAGRSLILNANITTDNGSLTLIANDTAANGVVDADRDAGTAVISMASGTAIDAGTGTVYIRLDDGAGNTNTTSGDITLASITANYLTVISNGGVDHIGALTIAGSYDLTAAGAVTQSAGTAFIGGTFVFDTGAGNDVTFGLAGNDFGVVRATSAGSVVINDDFGTLNFGGDMTGALTLDSVGNINLQTSSVGGQVSLTSGASVVQYGPLTGGQEVFVDVVGDARINYPGNAITSISGSGTNIFARTSVGNLTAGNLSGGVGLTASNQIQLYSDANIIGNGFDPVVAYMLSFYTSGNVVLNQVANNTFRLGGNIGGTLDYVDANNITLSGLNVTGAATIETSGAVTDSTYWIWTTNSFGSSLSVDTNSAGSIILDELGSTYSGVVSLNAGSQSVDISTNGSLNLGTGTGNTFLAEAGGDITLSGLVSAYGNFGDSNATSIVLAAGGNFIEGASGDLDPGKGRFIVYSQEPALNTLVDLSATPWYNTTYNNAAPTAVTGSGNRFAYSLAATLTVTPDPASRDYGDANPAFTYTITGLVGGDTLAGAVSGTPDLATTADQHTGVGDYEITAGPGSLASDYNYAFQFGSNWLTINPATLTVTADDASREYGDANPTFTGVVTGFKNGEDESVISGLTYGSAATQNSNVGTYAISGSGASAANYVFTYVDGTLTINPATLTVTADDASREYGDANPTFTGVVTGFKNGEDESVISGLTYGSTATQISNVGAYAISGSGATATNYVFTYVNGTLTIIPATLTITADDAAREYGDANPAFTGVVTGFKNGEDESVISGLTYVTAATQTSNVGTYAIVGSGATATNYVFTYVDGTLTINPATLTITADDAAREYGDANPAFTGVVTGFKNGEDESVISGLTYGSAATQTSNVGTYAISGSGATATNYVFTYVDGTLTINPATLTVTADDAAREYGDANPTFSGVITGFKNGEDGSVITGAASYSTVATTGSDVGSYAISTDVGAMSSTNYIFVGVDGSLTITPAPLTVIADDASRVFGVVNPTFTGTVTGFKNGEDESVLSGLTYDSLADEDTEPGEYAIFSVGGTATNYVIVERIDGILTILPLNEVNQVNNDLEGGDDGESGSGGLGGDSDPGSPFGSPNDDFEPGEAANDNQGNPVLCWLGIESEKHDCDIRESGAE